MTSPPRTPSLDRRSILGLSVAGVAALAGCGATDNAGEPSGPNSDNSEQPNRSQTEDEVVRERDLDGGNDATKR